MSKVSTTPEMPKLISVHDYLNIKLDRNKIYTEFLKKHNEVIKKEIILNYRTSEINKKKLDMFATVDAIEKKQLIQFSPEQEEYVKTIYMQINKLIPENEDDLLNQINKLKEECVVLLDQINDFNIKIPNTLDITYT
jgi:hypothetical protein